MSLLEFLGRVWEVLTRPIDSFLFGCALALVGVGLVTLFSAADQSTARVTSQVVSCGFALVLMWLVANVPPQTLARAAVPLYVVGLLLLVGVALIGVVGQWVAALAEPRHRAHPAIGTHEDRLAADARVVLPEVRGAHRLEGFRHHRRAHRGTRVPDQAPAGPRHVTDDRRLRASTSCSWPGCRGR